MANCHHRRVPLLTLALTFCLPFLIAIAARLAGSHMRAFLSSSFLQASLHHHHHLQKQQQSNDELYFLSPGAASLRGRRPYQEDRLLCAPRIRVRYPVLGHLGIDAGLYGIFDGHLGDAASDFAAKSITDRFLHRTASGFMAGASSMNRSSPVEDMPWLEASLLAAISDIDKAFGKLAVTHSIKSGSTACVALQVRDQILVANVGDSKGFFCSSCNGMEHRRDEHQHAGALRSYRKPRRRVSRISEEASLSSHSGGLCAQKLSSDHRPDRPDEKLRIEASGGFVTNGSLPRVNGQLAVSRSIGDIDLQKYGVISEPELSGWQQVSENDKFLILASDGIFEKLSPQEVCNVIHALGSGQDLTSIMDRLEVDNNAVIALPGVSSSEASSNEGTHILGPNSHSLTSSSAHIATIDACQAETHSVNPTMPFFQGASGIAQIMAQILLEIAYRAGSMDNLSAIVVPLKAATD